MTKNILLTCIALLSSIILFEYSGIDFFIQDFFYDFELKQWFLDRNEPIAKLVFYDGIKVVLVTFILIIISGLLFFRKTQLIQKYRKDLIIVVLSTIMVPVSVGALKATTNVPCPKNLKHYNGTYPYVTLLKEYPRNFYQPEKIKCYPAAHASGGFGFLALIFLFKTRRNKVVAALSVLGTGWSMGTYKMLIGDHFLSHTVVSMIFAWFVILIIAKCVDGQADNYGKIWGRKIPEQTKTQ